ncbi:hypothetical protein [Nocardia sp. NPDC052566]|uniref:hypothetical protein n=1 Tax=Nocardia sp. NPDC052566 TaxID=3364330 RepID=UPI0037C56DD9
MTTIVEFIQSRVAEDESAAHASADEHGVRQARAWRTIVRAILEYEGEIDYLAPSAGQRSDSVDQILALRAIAEIWPQHPDYRRAWGTVTMQEDRQHDR